jgi:hypothetical protein
MAIPIGWEGLVGLAVSLMARATEIFDLVKSWGVSQQDLDQCIAKNRAARAARLAADREADWPSQ